MLTQEGAADALEAACVPHGGQTPDAVFLCAGYSTPGFFIEQTEESMRKGMDNTYWLAACSALVRNPLGPAFYPGPDLPQPLGSLEADDAHGYQGKNRLCFLHPGLLWSDWLLDILTGKACHTR